MRWILTLVALLGLAAYPAMAAAPIDKGVTRGTNGVRRSRNRKRA